MYQIFIFCSNRISLTANPLRPDNKNRRPNFVLFKILDPESGTLNVSSQGLRRLMVQMKLANVLWWTNNTQPPIRSQPVLPAPLIHLNGISPGKMLNKIKHQDNFLKMLVRMQIPSHVSLQNSDVLKMLAIAGSNIHGVLAPINAVNLLGPVFSPPA